MAINEETQQLTLAAFHAIMSKGERPTVDLVLAWMDGNGHGRKNRNAISTALKQCWSDLAARTTIDPRLQELPQEAIDLVLKLQLVLFEDAKGVFIQDLQDAKGELANQLADAQRRVDEATAAVDTAHESLSSEAAARQRAEVMVRDLQNKLATQEGLLQAAAIAKADADRSAAVQREQIASLERQLAGTIAAHEAAIESEAARFNEMQHALQVRLDEARTEREQTKTTLLDTEERLNQARAEIRNIERSASAELTKISTELGAARAEVKVLQGLQAKTATELAEALRQSGQAAMRTEQAEAACEQLRQDLEGLQRRLPITADALEQLLIEAVVHGHGLAKTTGAKPPSKLSISAASSQYGRKVVASLKATGK
jgi:DNA repair exonuclease SbcCD ATPase subunit